MANYHNVHVGRVANKAIAHQAVDLEMSLTKWIKVILDYVGARPAVAMEIYDIYLDTNGHADTVPEMEAVHA